MNEKIIKLSEWGCDTKSALERMLNDEDFYLECLSSIPQDESFEKLIETIKNGDASAAFDYAHTLKGVLANLGLTPMYKKTVEIVEPLRNGECDGMLDKAHELNNMKKYLSIMLG